MNKLFLVGVLAFVSMGFRQETKIYTETEVDQVANFGYSADLRKFLRSTVSYPAEAQRKNKMGTVKTQFVVRADGSIDLNSIKTVKSVFLALDQEAARTIALMPKWAPAKKNGQAVASYVVQPISFTLEANNKCK
jgi:TonB family protein